MSKTDGLIGKTLKAIKKKYPNQYKGAKQIGENLLGFTPVGYIQNSVGLADGIEKFRTPKKNL